MRKVLLLALLIAASCASTAHAFGVGLGVEGGPSWPVLQDDRGNGSVWGVRLPVNLVTFLTLEPYYMGGTYKSKTVDTPSGPQTRDGGKVNSWGMNLALANPTARFSFYPFAGIGSSTESRASIADITNTSYNFGLGLGLGLHEELSLTVRGEMQMVVNGDVSRKFGNLTFGLTYHFFNTPY